MYLYIYVSVSVYTYIGMSVHACMRGQLASWLACWVDGRKDGCMDAWMQGGREGGWREGWMDGGRSLNPKLNSTQTQEGAATSGRCQRQGHCFASACFFFLRVPFKGVFKDYFKG